MSHTSSILGGITQEPFRALLELLSLPPDRLRAAFGMLAAFVVVCELVRIALGTEHTRSVLAHVTICLLTCPRSAGSTSI